MLKKKKSFPKDALGRQCSEANMIRTLKEEECLNSKDEYCQPDNIAQKFCKNGRTEEEDDDKSLSQEQKIMKENLFKKILAENLEERAKKKIAVKKKRDDLRSECQNKEDELNKKKKQKFDSLKAVSYTHLTLPTNREV